MLTSPSAGPLGLQKSSQHQRRGAGDAGTAPRPVRQQLGLTQTQIAATLTITVGTDSLIERGLVHDNESVRTYDQWLSQRVLTSYEHQPV